jgi:AcrR family transcriptional regulator
LSAVISDADDEKLDRRARRTRSAIVSAFNRLILERGYASLTPGEVAAAADVGRSTFYEHFRSMDDLLAKTLGVVLEPLAEGCLEVHPSAQARLVLEHIWEHRRVARLLIEGDSRSIVLRGLAAQFQVALQRGPQTGGSPPLLPPDLIALQLAAGQLALLGAWLSRRSGLPAEVLAVALHSASRATALALLAPSEA